MKGPLGLAQRENDRRKERGIWGGALEENRGPHLTAVLQPADRTLYRVPTLDPRRPLISLRRFLTLAPACWPQGKIPPHPSARSAHSSTQNGGPKGKMIEGRSGGSGRGTRRESWAPPDSGSAHRRIAGLYRVRRSTRSRSPSHFLPSAASSPVAPACWPQGKILPHPSARSALHSSPQDGGPKGKMIEGRSGGSGRPSERNVGPQLTGGSQIGEAWGRARRWERPR